VEHLAVDRGGQVAVDVGLRVLIERGDRVGAEDEVELGERAGLEQRRRLVGGVAGRVLSAVVLL
jgi:hypothetical protein